MGCVFFFDEIVTSNDNQEKRSKCTVEVLDNQSIPEIRIGPEEEAYKGRIAQFDNWEQFTKFVAAVNSLHTRLSGLHK